MKEREERRRAWGRTEAINISRSHVVINTIGVKSWAWACPSLSLSHWRQRSDVNVDLVGVPVLQLCLRCHPVVFFSQPACTASRAVIPLHDDFRNKHPIPASERMLLLMLFYKNRRRALRLADVENEGKVKESQRRAIQTSRVSDIKNWILKCPPSASNIANRGKCIRPKFPASE